MNKLPIKTFVNVIMVLLILACGIFSSCGEENLFYEDHYHKCFFLGENSFQIKGEVFSDPSYETPRPFEYIDFQLIDNNVSPRHMMWEIPATKISENKFEAIIDIMVDRIPIENGKVEQYNDYNVIDYYLFPKGFPAYALHYRKDRDYYYDAFKIFGGYEYFYLYIGEPIDLSATYTEKHSRESLFSRDYNVITTHKDLNFSKPGWYKVIFDYEKIGNDPKFSSGENTKFWYTVY